MCNTGVVKRIRIEYQECDSCVLWMSIPAAKGVSKVKRFDTRVNDSRALLMSSHEYVVVLKIAGFLFSGFYRQHPNFLRQVFSEWNNFQHTDVYQRKTQHLGCLCDQTCPFRLPLAVIYGCWTWLAHLSRVRVDFQSLIDDKYPHLMSLGRIDVGV